MKQFSIIVFGGIALIGVSIGIIYVVAFTWKEITPIDGTTLHGLKRTVMFTAKEEEDSTPILPESSIIKNTSITAPAYIIKNLSRDGDPIVKNPDTIMPIASLTKLVTAVVARKLLPLTSHVTITPEVIAAYGNTGGFKPGETMAASDLYYPLLMVSSNEAAEALARTYGRTKFIQAMNDFTQSIGAYRTYFADPSGLSALNVSTAKDLALILDWIVKNDKEIIDMTELKMKNLKSHIWVNPTHFLSWSNYAGGKNGYTPEADRTAASLFTLGKNNDLYAVVVLGSQSRDSDELQLLKKISD